MLKTFLEAMGDLFKRVYLDIVVGLILASLALLPKIQLTGINSTVDIVNAIGTFIIVVIATTAVFQFLGIVFIRVSELISVNAEIKPLDKRDEEMRYYDDGMVIKAFASLSIKNKEHTTLTECYAILRKANFHDWKAEDVTHKLTRRVGQSLLKWSDSSDSKSKCITSISPYGGVAVLRVYEVDLKHSKENSRNSITLSDFCICTDDNKVTISLLPTYVYDVEIEVHGKLNGKDVKLGNFEGYIEVQNRHNEAGDFIKQLSIREKTEDEKLEWLNDRKS
jgi:hypothetical protein